MSLFRLKLATAGTVLMLCVLVSAASANRLRSSGGTMRAVFPSATFSGGWGSTSCALTLEGSLHSLEMTKTAGALVGYITRGSIAPCPVGTASILLETFPWHVQYVSFTGVLPNISSLLENIVGASWWIREPFGIRCLFTSTTSAPATAKFTREAGGALTKVELGGAIRSGDCFELSGTTSGASSGLWNAGTTSRITVTLI
jgi:hypothetical protein